ncbi:uncharacterized protein LOC114754356 isoform X2 [Neltuma alba]|uniref:uncharacterized protein LOC114754356 isoform X2 n=1 Tax=Neltuma alba TaxID=207710 RepID=UPI0010A3167D|nr:uncharacterized protein LOC114754356 isoform X2 [Prosopis alba]
MAEIKIDEPGEFGERPIFRDIRRYSCEYCGICRSKKTLITSHINSCHKEELERVRVDKDEEATAQNPILARNVVLVSKNQPIWCRTCYAILSRELQNSRGRCY